MYAHCKYFLNSILFIIMLTVWSYYSLGIWELQRQYKKQKINKLIKQISEHILLLLLTTLAYMYHM